MVTQHKFSPFIKLHFFLSHLSIKGDTFHHSSRAHLHDGEQRRHRHRHGHNRQAIPRDHRGGRSALRKCYPPPCPIPKITVFLFDVFFPTKAARPPSPVLLTPHTNLLPPPLPYHPHTAPPQAIDDPDEEPFKSKYAANALLEALDAQLTKLLLTSTDGADPLNAASADRALLDVKALVTHRRGALAVDTEEWGKGGTLLMEAKGQLTRIGASSVGGLYKLIQIHPSTH
jgi:hypothetical protein